MGAGLIQFGRRLAAVGVRAASRFGQAVAPFELASGQAWDVLLFLGVVAVVQNGQRADACVGGETHREAVSATHALGDEHGALEVQPKAAEVFWHGAAEQPQFSDFLQKLGRQAFFKGFDAFEVGDDPLGHKVEAGLEHHAVFFGPLFRREDFICTHVTDEEFSASDGLGGLGVSSGHVVVDWSISKTPAAPCPVPTHIVTMPCLARWVFNSLRSCTVSLAPVQPRGCPRAMAPP